MSIHTQHSAGDCEVCAAQQEADAVGAIPTAGHERTKIEALAKQIAIAIRIGEQRTNQTAELLIAFAEEIKRQAIEPA